MKQTRDFVYARFRSRHMTVGNTRISVGTISTENAQPVHCRTSLTNAQYFVFFLLRHNTSAQTLVKQFAESQTTYIQVIFEFIGVSFISKFLPLRRRNMLVNGFKSSMHTHGDLIRPKKIFKRTLKITIILKFSIHSKHRHVTQYVSLAQR